MNRTAPIQFMNFTNDPKFQVPTELDYLFNDIANPKPDTTPDKILSYLVYYYPKLKNKSNVELLTNHFLRCPVFFATLETLTVENLAKIIECFHFILTSKYQVTNPSIPFHEFYRSIYDSCRLFLTNEPTLCWRVIPILGGCISSISVNETYNPYPHYGNVLTNVNGLIIQSYSDSLLRIIQTGFGPELKDPYLFSLIYTQEHLPHSYFTTLSQINPKILPELMRILFFSPNGLDKGALLNSNIPYPEVMKNFPVLRQLNKWAFLFGKISKSATAGEQLNHTLSLSLNYIGSFCSNISNENLVYLKLNSDKWELVKFIFFTIIIIYEQSTMVILSGKTKMDNTTFIIANQILHGLFYLSYILDQIGTGGFDSYNFIFDSATSLLREHNPKMAEALAYSLLNELPVEKSTSLVIDSKLSYFLRIAESLLPSLQYSFKETTLFPLIDRILKGNYSLQEIEFAHSIMINHLNLLCNTDGFQSENEYQLHLRNIIFPYYNHVLTQFPKHLSLGQTSLITQTCGKVVSISSNEQTGLLSSLIDMVRSQIATASYAPLPAKTIKTNGEEIVIHEKFHSRRAGLILLYIDLLQFVRYPQFIETLADIKRNIDMLMGDHDIYTLYDTLWEKLLLINKYDCQQGQIGLDWWYDTINHGLVPKI